MLRKTAPEQRAPFYEDIETLIAPGFLSKQASVHNVPFSFRSLYPRDLFLLRNWTSGGRDWRTWAVATSIWMVDGLPLFRAGVESVRILAQWVGTLPTGYLERLFALVTTLYKRSREAMDDIQPYLYEARSRQLWNSTNRGVVFDDRFFGIPGVQDLGRNHVQKIWTVWNQNEDQTSNDRLQWQMTKSIISAHAPKGARRMNATDKTRERAESERRERVLDMFYYRKMGVLGDDAVLYDAQGQPITRIGGASTPAELADEFLRWVRGEEDLHDTVVREVKERILRNMEAAEQEKRQAIQQSRQAAESDLPEDYDLVGYTEEQINDLSDTQGRGGVRRVYDQATHEKARTWVSDTNPPLPEDQIKMLYQPPEQEQRKARPDVNRMIRSRLPKVD